MGVLALFECGLAGQFSLLPSGHRYTLPASKSFRCFTSRVCLDVTVFYAQQASPS